MKNKKVSSTIKKVKFFKMMNRKKTLHSSIDVSYYFVFWALSLSPTWRNEKRCSQSTAPVVLPEEQSVDGGQAGLDDGSLIPGHEVTRPLRGRRGKPALGPSGQRRLPNLLFSVIIFRQFFLIIKPVYFPGDDPRIPPGASPRWRSLSRKYCSRQWTRWSS